MGFSYEQRFATKLLKQGAQKVTRHYGSLGISDIEWVDSLGFKNEAQLKFSSIRLPKVSAKEMERIKPYAKKIKKKGIKCWIVCKMSHGAEIWTAMN